MSTTMMRNRRLQIQRCTTLLVLTGSACLLSSSNAFVPTTLPLPWNSKTHARIVPVVSMPKDDRLSLSVVVTASASSAVDDTNDLPHPASSNGPNMNQAVKVRRKAAKRTRPFDLAADEELNLVSSSPPQAEDNPARKKPRLEEPRPTTTDKAARKSASPDLSVSLPPPAGDDDDDANAAPMTDTQPNAVSSNRATGRWTLEEDAKLTEAITSTSKKMVGNEYKTDWVVIAALVPGRTRSQCSNRWHNALDPSIDRVNGRTDKWTVVEDSKLKGAVQTHGGKDWAAVAALLPGRTKKQCWNRWHDALDPSIDRAKGRTGLWAEDEDVKLKDAVQTHGGKNWAAIAALVPGRTKSQCWSRWNDVLDPTIVRGSTLKWTADEDSELKDAVQTHGDKNWAAISALVPGRTKRQCRNRWHDALDPSIDRANERTGIWAEDEDIKLKDAVQLHGGKNWAAIAALVPSRTKIQCWSRWNDVLDPSIARGSTRKWTADEDMKLKDAVQTHGVKNWVAISALFPSRTKRQCWHRWDDALDPSIDRTNGRTGEWTADEVIKLKDAVQTHGGRNWTAIAALVPGRTKQQCDNKWYDVLYPSIDWANGSRGGWSADEEIKLKDAVQLHGGKNWAAIAALVPGRTMQQCSNKWQDVLDPKRWKDFRSRTLMKRALEEEEEKEEREGNFVKYKEATP